SPIYPHLPAKSSVMHRPCIGLRRPCRYTPVRCRARRAFVGDTLPALSLSLKTKITVAVSLLTALLLTILACCAQLYFVDQIKQMVCSQQSTMVSAIADQIDDKLLATQTELVSTAGTLSRSIINDPS